MIVAAPNTTERSTRLLTAADLAVLPTRLPSGDVRWELDDGRLVVMPPPGDIHGAVQSNVGYELKGQGEERGLGKARTEVGIVLWRDPDKVVGADAAFIALASLPIRRTPEGYLETIPDVAAEVRSKNDTDAELELKVEDYLRAGVKIVWVIDPFSRTVTVHRRDRPPRTLTEDEILTADEVIPGFQVVVRKLLQD